MKIKKPHIETKALVPVELIERRIYLIRGHKVMLDSELAELYQVKPIALRQQVKRNMDRFPKDFMFQLTEKEASLLVSQSVIPSKQSLGGYLPYVFTQEGVAMLSSVLRSKRAIQVNIAIMRAFVRLREMMESNKELASKLDALEKKYDSQFAGETGVRPAILRFSVARHCCMVESSRSCHSKIAGVTPVCSGSSILVRRRPALKAD